jgi:hypothetical protein
MTFHVDKIIDHKLILEKQSTIKILIGSAAFKSAEFYLKFDDSCLPTVVSIKKCMIGLTDDYKNEIES